MNAYLQNLKEILDLMTDAVYWFNRSFNICKDIGIKQGYSEQELDNLEALASRFARVVDIIISKVFRAIDKVEFEEKGTMIDVVNRAEKRGLITSTDRFREIKELRNNIVHEYEKGEIVEKFKEIFAASPEVLDIVDRIDNYCKGLIAK
ncbi:MAG: hypothetical protein HQK91_13225 [Nitrospirae bacterium]|nr:hypothetical protein [Nitrospirota bacterium]